MRRAYGRNNTLSVISHLGTARDLMNARHFHFSSSVVQLDQRVISSGGSIFHACEPANFSSDAFLSYCCQLDHTPLGASGSVISCDIEPFRWNYRSLNPHLCAVKWVNHFAIKEIPARVPQVTSYWLWSWSELEYLCLQLESIRFILNEYNDQLVRSELDQHWVIWLVCKQKKSCFRLHLRLELMIWMVSQPDDIVLLIIPIVFEFLAFQFWKKESIDLSWMDSTIGSCTVVGASSTLTREGAVQLAA